MITTEDYFRDSITNFGFTPDEGALSRGSRVCGYVNVMLMDFGQERGMTSGHRTREKTLQLREHGYAAAIGGTHETAEGIDIEDGGGDLDTWLDDDKLAKYGLYREHPASTRGWCHVQTRSPRSGNRTFYP